MTEPTRRAPWDVSADGFEHVGDELVHQGHIWHLSVGTFRAPDGTEFTRDIVRSPGSVGVVALMDTAEGPSVTLISQYRPPQDRSVLEIPAGMRDVPGEVPVATAQRELIEEAGLRAGALYQIAEMMPSPGLTDSTCTIFLATGCTAVDHDRQGPEEQALVVVDLMLADALALIDNGTIQDAKTIIGLLMAKRYSDGDLHLDD